ncbi:transporter substrate-binding domain-containing protein [Rhizobiales bacterium TNE-4]|nr:transporter substrate-binding domain-containing protein [Rhizobiales bacterium TNE-4]MBV1828829.1 transporter substrate-binding domain-containing protein [Rhizobiales bacterium TNE-4]
MTQPFTVPPVSSALRVALAPRGHLRAGINLSNMLLVSAQSPDGSYDGVSPDMARAIASALDVPCVLVPFPSPGAVADALADDAWDIALIGAEPQRAIMIAFTQAYAEIEACYAVRNDSAITTNQDVDKPGIRIATMVRAAFTLWLERNITHAALHLCDSLDKARDAFANGDADVLASLKSKIIDYDLPGTRIIEPGFMTVQQAIGCARTQDPTVAHWLNACVRSACAGGFVARQIAARGVKGLKAAAPD